MILSKFFSIFGIICIITACVLFWQRNNPKRLVFKNLPPTVNVKGVRQSVPSRLIIREANIDLQIFPAKIRGQKWDLTTEGVSWLDISSIPGEVGNSIIYGHNWTNILGNLFYVKPGQKIEIVYKDGSVRIFTVQNTAIVSPNDVTVLSQTKDRRVTIYTCTGILDQKRFVVTGTLSQKQISK